MEKVQLILHPYTFIPTSTVIREMRVLKIYNFGCSTVVVGSFHYCCKSPKTHEPYHKVHTGSKVKIVWEWHFVRSILYMYVTLQFSKLFSCSENIIYITYRNFGLQNPKKSFKICDIGLVLANFFALDMGHKLLILKIYATFKDAQIIYKWFVDISTGFRFQKWECSVHFCSCPCLQRSICLHNYLL